MTHQEIEVIVAMYKEDVSYSEIAKVIGKSEHTVKHWVRNNRGEYGLDKRRAARHTQGVLSEALWADSKWNVKLGVELISRKWA